MPKKPKSKVIRLEGVDPEWLLQPANRQKALDILSRNDDKLFALLSPDLQAKYARRRALRVSVSRIGDSR